MEHAFEVLNRLEAQGLICKYAIGGAVAYGFHVKPLQCFDLDVFVLVSQTTGDPLQPVLEALEESGYVRQGNGVSIKGTSVRFVAGDSPLVQEALAEATEISYGNIPIRVFRSEYLLAILIDSGEDREQFHRFKEQADFDLYYLGAILERHGLKKKWLEWNRNG